MRVQVVNAKRVWKKQSAGPEFSDWTRTEVNVIAAKITNETNGNLEWLTTKLSELCLAL